MPVEVTPELTPQQAAAVWAEVPVAETALTAKVAGLSNVLTGLAFLLAPLPVLAIELADRAAWGRWTWEVSFGGAVLVFALFFALRFALWRVYGMARPGSTLGRAYDAGARPGYRVWYIAAILWILALSFAKDAVNLPGPVEATTGLWLLFAVYLVTMGHWESRQPWSRRPYLLAVGVIATAASWMLAAFGPDLDLVRVPILGLGWILAGLLIFRQG